MGKVTHTTKRLIMVMGLFAILATVVIQWYYKNRNTLIDPRIAGARELYGQYNQLAEENNTDALFQLLDTIEEIYTGVAHYASSFETGVIYNNRAAIWLTEGLHGNNLEETATDSLVRLAENAVRKSIHVYRAWKEKYQHLDADNIVSEIRPEFQEGLDNYSDEEKEKFIETRAREIDEAKIEIERRLSVSLTNLGIIYRHHEKYDSAMQCYKEALDLWDRNITAENNINKMLGRPVRKQGFIEKMFPKERL